MTLGRTFEEMDELNDALTAFKYAFKRFPKEPGLHEKIVEIESKIKKEKQQ